LHLRERCCFFCFSFFLVCAKNQRSIQTVQMPENKVHATAQLSKLSVGLTPQIRTHCLLGQYLNSNFRLLKLIFWLMYTYRVIFLFVFLFVFFSCFIFSPLSRALGKSCLLHIQSIIPPLRFSSSSHIWKTGIAKGRSPPDACVRFKQVQVYLINAPFPSFCEAFQTLTFYA